MPRRLPRVAFALPPLLLLLAACEADNVQWAFVSNPGGSFGTTGGAVIVIRITSTSSASTAGDFVRVDGVDDRGTVGVLLPLRGDFGVLQRGDAVELRSPALSFDDGTRVRPGRFEAANASVQVPPAGGPAALRVQLPDSSLLHPAGFGPGTLHVARAGTLLILESGAGIVVFGEKDEPEVIGTSATLTTNPAGTTFGLLRPDNTVRLLFAPPLPLPEQRLLPVPQHDAVRILGPIAEPLAELPARAVTVQNGAGGLFLSAELPEGLPGDPGAFRLLMAAHNRYLLRVDQ
jgi:hypothetical protein